MKNFYCVMVPQTRQVIAMCDEDALGSAVAVHLRQYVIGKAGVLVEQVTELEFDAKRSPGTVRLV